MLNLSVKGVDDARGGLAPASGIHSSGMINKQALLDKLGEARCESTEQALSADLPLWQQFVREKAHEDQVMQRVDKNFPMCAWLSSLVWSGHVHRDPLSPTSRQTVSQTACISSMSTDELQCRSSTQIQQTDSRSAPLFSSHPCPLQVQA